MNYSLESIAKSKFILAKMIYDKSMEYVPVDTGKLKKSGYIRKRGAGYEVGFSADYATYVHEIPNHHEAPTQSKFLEDAALEMYEEAVKYYEISTEVKITYEPLAVYIGVNGAPGNILGSNMEKMKKNLKNFEMFIEVSNMFV